MSDRDKKRTLEEQEDDFLQELFDAAAEEKSEALWKAYQAELEAGTAPEMPEELDTKCRELIRASEKKRKRIQFQKYVGIGLKRVAIIALVMIALASTLVVSVDAIRVPVLNLFVTDKDRKSTIYFQSEQEEENTTISEKVLSTRLPLGYKIEEVSQSKNGVFSCLFTEEKGAVIQVKIMPCEVMVDFDTEDAEQISTEVNGWPAVFVKKNGYRAIWVNSDENLIYNIFASELTETAFWKYVYQLAR